MDPLPEGTLPGDGPGTPSVLAPRWPAPPAAAAFSGLAGEFVHLVAPHSEADPVALLAQCLLYFGSALGRGPHFLVEGARHGMNEFMVLVGSTAKARKGTSQGRVEQLWALIDPDFLRERVSSGLSSGEGLIAQVRDPVERREPVGERGKVAGFQNVVLDEGVEDKRLLVAEGEFASVLRVLGRQGNTLSPLLRSAWDGRALRTLVKNAPYAVMEPHISLLGHITQFELLLALDASEMSNGLANRILWFAARRSKLLPEGGQLPEEGLRELARRFRERLAWGQQIGEVRRHESAKDTWAEIYRRKAQDRLGYVGAILARAEAHLMRLAALYALLDASPLVLPAHLGSALALWDYAEASVEFVFGQSLGNPVADRILSLLRDAPDGLDREQIRDAFSRRKSAAQIEAALRLLQAQGLAYCERRATGGRPEERWFATQVGAT